MKLHRGKLIGSTWYYQRAVPRPLQAKIRKKVFKENLKVARSDVKEAKRRILEWDERTDAIIAEAMRDPWKEAQERINAMPEAERAELLRMIPDARAGSEVDAVLSELRKRAWNLGDNLHQLDALTEEPDAVEREIKLFALKKRLLEPHAQARDTYLKIHGHNDGNKKINDVLAIWQREINPKPNQLSVYGMAVRRLIEVCGDKPISSITREDIAGYKEKIAELPDTSPRDFHGLTVDQCISRRKAEKLPAIRGNIVARHIGAIRMLLDIAKSSGLITQNVAEGVKVYRANTDEDEEKGRVPFNAADINSILAAIVKRTTPDKDDFWFFPIALLTGARIDEIGRMKRSDVCREGEIWYFHMRILKASKKKAVAKRKKVPLHQALIDAGFLNFVSSSKEEMLFSTCKPDKYGRHTGALSKRLAYIQRDVAGITDPKKTFHSTRHSFEDAARNAKIPLDWRRWLVGRLSDIAAEDQYGEGANVAALNEEIQKVKYPGVDWSLLTRVEA